MRAGQRSEAGWMEFEESIYSGVFLTPDSWEMLSLVDLMGTWADPHLSHRGASGELTGSRGHV